MKQRLRRQAREDAGLCICCDGRRLGSSSRCGKCLDKERERMRQKRGSRRRYTTDRSTAL